MDLMENAWLLLSTQVNKTKLSEEKAMQEIFFPLVCTRHTKIQGLQETGNVQSCHLEKKLRNLYSSDFFFFR